MSIADRNEGAARVAIIVACFAEGEMVAKAVGSIQESEPVEVVVVDGGTTHAPTLAVLERLRGEGVHVINRERDEGVGATRNTGLAATTAPYVFPLDGDDEAVPGSFGKMADRLDADPGAAVCYGDYLDVGTQTIVRGVPPEIDPYRLAYANEYPGASMFRRTDLERIGGWVSLAPGYEDWNIWLNLAGSGARGVYAGEGVLTFRYQRRPDSMESRSRKQHAQLYQMLRDGHPEIFEHLREHRRRSTLDPMRKLLYPVVYGRRPKTPLDGYAKRWLDRKGIWTLSR